ncbi:MAG: MFS transporter [Anaerolineae bacterium]
MNSPKRTGMQTFLLIWFGQVISLTGSGMTRFALLIWAYEHEGSATTLALLGFISFIFYVLLSPVAGVWVDRLDRRAIMLASDSASGVLTLLLLILYTSGHLQLWHVFVYEGMTGALDAFQTPAFIAATTSIIPPHERARVNGLRTMVGSISRVFAPLLAGIVLAAGGLSAVMGIDLLTFIAAYATLITVRLPKPQRVAVHHSSMGRELREAFRYVRERRELFALILVFTVMNFIASLTYLAVMPAMILARPGGGEEVLALVRATMGVAAVVGGVAAALLPKRIRLIDRILISGAISFLGGDLLMGMGQSLPIWLIAAVVTEFFIPIMIGASRTIVQNRVPDAMQGRVFALDGMLRELAIPVGYLLAGPLADRVFEPAMIPGGALAAALGGMFGTGHGAGMGVMYLFTAVSGTILCLSAYGVPALRRLRAEEGIVQGAADRRKSATIEAQKGQA